LRNNEEELKKLLEELNYNRGFLKSVMKKLSNENFVNNAPAKVIEMENRKRTDVETKIKAIEERILSMKK
jgi:valyl-tRNA synthetase